MTISSPFKSCLGTQDPDSSMLFVKTEVHCRGVECWLLSPQCRGDLLLPVSSKHWAVHPSLWLFPEAAAKAPVSRVRAVRLSLRLWKFKLLALCPQPGCRMGAPSGAQEHLCQDKQIRPGPCPVLMSSASFQRVLTPLTHSSCRRD